MVALRIRMLLDTQADGRFREVARSVWTEDPDESTNSRLSAASSEQAHDADAFYRRSSTRNMTSKEATDLNEVFAAADAGDAEAQYRLGNLFAHGEGVARDPQTACNWFLKAAEQDHVEAQAKLGAVYAAGGGVKKDFAKAISWFRRAAERGHLGAQVKLGAAYLLGYGVPKNLVLSYVWRSLAADQGVESAKVARDSLEKMMTPSQLAEARRLTREWRPDLGR
jgi:TPR repeat protein